MKISGMLATIFLASCVGLLRLTHQVPLDGRAFQGQIGGPEAIPLPPNFQPFNGCTEDPATNSQPQQSRVPPTRGAGSGDLLTGSREFALNLFKTAVAKSEPGNVFMSPASIWLALTSAYMGARGETATQLATLLGLSTTDRGQLAGELSRLRTGYQTQSPAGSGNTLRLANRFYLERGLPLCPRIAEYLGGESSLQQLDFTSAPEESRGAINNWVEETTESKIKDLLSPGDVDRFTRLVLVNAAYFNGQWAVRFDEKRTRPQKFYTQPELGVSSQFVQVSMMVVRDDFPYVQSRALGARIVELPFVGGDYSLFAAIPSIMEDHLEDVVARLTPSALREALSGMRSRTITLSLPRLRVEQSMELKDVVDTLGAGALFDRARADLSGFAGNRDLFVGKIKHKAFVELNERGAVAAAATAIVIQTYSAIQDDVVTFNRPFLFFIRDNRLDSILFAGLVRQPEEVTG